MSRPTPTAVRPAVASAKNYRGALGVLTLQAPTDSTGSVTTAIEQLAPTIRIGERLRATDSGAVVVEFEDSNAHRIRTRLRELALVLLRTPALHRHESPAGITAADLSETAAATHPEIGIGWARRHLHGDDGDHRALAKATAHSRDSLRRRDLQALPATTRTRQRQQPLPSTGRASFQIVLSVLLSVPVPVIILIAAYQWGLDLSPLLYVGLVAAVLITVGAQIAESVCALAPPRAPEHRHPAPKATAIIAAYLPNEAATIMETVDRFLALPYAGDLEIILAYNSPRTLPVEAELLARSESDPRLRLLNVHGSTSKAQNVNAAIGVITGEFVGVFDADHLPMSGAFDRAWRWLGGGYDIVQGHCVVRNGRQGLMQRLVAVEFEMIYAVSHVGRQRVHGFGIFGGSNGFWRTSALREIRMRTDRLTEDIDASLRALLAGYRCVNDRALVSRELAPASFGGWWNQRQRWAQGWLEVSLVHSRSIWRRGELTAQQRVGLWLILVWREVYFWVTPLIWSLMIFVLWRDGGVTLGSGVVLGLAIAVMCWGPIQLLIAYGVGDLEIKRSLWWWPLYALAALLFYQELKNMVGRVAQIRHAMGERHWIVTPRSAVVPEVAGPVPVALIGTA